MWGLVDPAALVAEVLLETLNPNQRWPAWSSAKCLFFYSRTGRQAECTGCHPAAGDANDCSRFHSEKHSEHKYECACRGTGLGALAGLPRLATLTLAQCGSLDEAGLAALARLPALRTLVLDNCEQLTDAGAAPLLGCRPPRQTSSCALCPSCAWLTDDAQSCHQDMLCNQGLWLVQ